MRASRGQTGCVCIPCCAGAVGLERDGWIAEVLRFGCHTVTALLMTVGWGEGDWNRAGVGRFSRVRTHEGASAADTLGAGCGRWAYSGGATHLPEVRRSLSNISRASLSRSGGMRLYPSLRRRRRSGKRRVVGS